MNTYIPTLVFLAATIGVVITASHNPVQVRLMGYSIYKQIEEQIMKLYPQELINWHLIN